MKKQIIICGITLAQFFTPGWSQAQSARQFTIRANEIKASIQPTMWGIFFEDINLGADGGLYAELVKNRSFEFAAPLMGWKVQRKQFSEGDVLVLNRKSDTRNPRYIQVTVNNAVKGTLSMTNEGFRGMGVKKDLRYDFSVMYRQAKPGVKIHAELVGPAGEILGSGILVPEASGEWKKQSISFNSSATEPKAKLTLWFEGSGMIDLDIVSLFPADTWKNRPGGFRNDMVQLLADMKPGFIRFPGGCIVEGRDLNNRYQWKKTIGPIEERQLIINRWNTEFAHRPAPDYFQTFGLGFFEYFQLAEDIGAEPLPILNAGMACQFNTAEVVPVNELDPFIQDALDLIEFANGDANSKWGKVRADMGHPKPFGLKMMGIGNENWGPQYIERLQAFTSAIKARYPKIKLVNSSGTDPAGDRFDYLNTELRKMNADFIDEHYYRSPEWFLQNAARYDSYPRNATKIFAGEYAAHVDKNVLGSNRNTLRAALAEAAFMTGLERNADVVTMASYAPLFAHVEGWQWAPDLIWVDNLRSYGTPNYYVQKLFSTNRGTSVVPLLEGDKPLTGQDGIYGSACIDKSSNELVIKLVNTSGKNQDANFTITSAKGTQQNARISTLTFGDPDAINTLDKPTTISPAEKELNLKGKQLTLDAGAYSLQVVRIKLK